MLTLSPIRPSSTESLQYRAAFLGCLFFIITPFTAVQQILTRTVYHISAQESSVHS